jgi:hypothetical protein
MLHAMNAFRGWLVIKLYVVNSKVRGIGKSNNNTTNLSIVTATKMMLLETCNNNNNAKNSALLQLKLQCAWHQARNKKHWKCVKYSKINVICVVF